MIMKNQVRSVTLHDVCVQITDGKHGDCQNQEGSGYYFLSCKDIHGNKLNYGTARQITATDFFDTHRRTKLEPYDILITNSGTIGRMAITPDNELTRRTTFQKSVAILKPISSQVVPKYLFYLLRSEVERLVEFAGGTAQKNLLLRDLRAFPIEIAPLPTQHKVAAILSAYDELIENNTRRIAILEEMAQRIYTEWFVHFHFPGHESVPVVESELGPVPEEWEVTRLGEIAREIRRSVKPEEVAPETPYVGLEHIPRKSIALTDWGDAGQIKSTKLHFKKGEILFGKIRPYFHKVAIAPINGICSTDTIVILPKLQKYFSIVMSCVSSERFVEYATTTSQGTKMPRADWKVLVKYPIVIPPDELLTTFSEIVQDIVSQIHNCIFRNANLRQTRDLLLPRLISGELDVSDLDIAGVDP